MIVSGKTEMEGIKTPAHYVGSYHMKLGQYLFPVYRPTHTSVNCQRVECCPQVCGMPMAFGLHSCLIFLFFFENIPNRERVKPPESKIGWTGSGKWARHRVAGIGVGWKVGWDGHMDG